LTLPGAYVRVSGVSREILSPRRSMAEILKVHPDDPSRWEFVLEYSIRLILAGKVVGFPTDTFYGLAADPFNLAAVSEVFRIKRRTPDRPLPLLVASLDQAADLALDPPRLFFTLAEKFWPGPLTLIVPASRLVPYKVTANTGKVGLRWPRAPLAVAMIAAADRPLTGTSANVSDQPACSTASQVEKQLGRALPLIVDGGPTEGKLPSTLVELTGSGGRILRQGGVSNKDLKEYLEPS
jgi:tRNA threonylcarbamoyl adenosine modification protein (Sua5/YciO/YrdC/YwlC family)